MVIIMHNVIWYNKYVRCTDIVRIISECFCSHSSMTLLYSVVCISIVIFRMRNIGISTNSAIPLFLFAYIFTTYRFILVFRLVTLVIGLVYFVIGLVSLVTGLVIGLVSLVTGLVPLVVLYWIVSFLVGGP